MDVRRAACPGLLQGLGLTASYPTVPSIAPLHAPAFIPLTSLSTLPASGRGGCLLEQLPLSARRRRPRADGAPRAGAQLVVRATSTTTNLVSIKFLTYLFMGAAKWDDAWLYAVAIACSVSGLQARRRTANNPTLT